MLFLRLCSRCVGSAWVPRPCPALDGGPLCVWGGGAGQGSRSTFLPLRQGKLCPRWLRAFCLGFHVALHSRLGLVYCSEPWKRPGPLGESELGRDGSGQPGVLGVFNILLHYNKFQPVSGLRFWVLFWTLRPGRGLSLCSLPTGSGAGPLRIHLSPEPWGARGWGGPRRCPPGVGSCP